VLPRVVRSDGVTKADRAYRGRRCVNKIAHVQEAEVEFAGEPSSVAGARRFAREVLDDAGAGDDSWLVVQIVSELATNAVVHAGTPFVLNIAYDDSSIRVSVTDGRPLARAVVRRFSSETTTGRGLRLIQTLGRSWGVDQTASAKTVWCEISRGAEADDDGEQASGRSLRFGSDDFEPAAQGRLQKSRARAIRNSRSSHVA
jgi:anti-sigma regulatory factor (Ser/Thr protein kinase)